MVYIFFLCRNNILSPSEDMAMSGNIQFFPVFLSTSFLQIWEANLHQNQSRGVWCALEDSIKISQQSDHRWRYSTKFKKKIHDYSQTTRPISMKIAGFLHQGLLHKLCKLYLNTPIDGATVTHLRSKCMIFKNVIFLLSECFLKILVNHVFSILWTLEDT